jgi:hypothetical protein
VAAGGAQLIGLGIGVLILSSRARDTLRRNFRSKAKRNTGDLGVEDP